MSKLVTKLLLAVVILALACGPAAAETPAVAYKDVGNHWAAGDIEKCKASGLMTGYPGDLFMPDKHLTRAEALAVIGKGLAWDQQAGSISMEGLNYPNDLWDGFRVYVAFAADKQLIAKEDIAGIKFNEPATRMELFSWLARALDLKGDANSLNFSDLVGISDSQKELLAGVVEAGIIKGLPGNLINPSGKLTRAEMAAILCRLIDSGRIVRGSDSRAPEDAGVLTGEKGYVIGKYHDYFTVHLGFGSVVRLHVANVSFLINGSSTSYGSLKPGAPVELIKSGSSVSAVRILNGTAKVFGKVKEYNSSVIVIKDEDGRTAIYDIDKKVEIIDVYGNQTGTEGIQVGLNAEISLRDNYNAVEIRMYESAEKELQGKVESLDTTGNKKITVIENGVRRTFYLAENVTPRDNGKDLRLEDVKAGMGARLTVNADNKVTGIEIIDLSTVFGRIVDVQTEGSDRITVKDRSGESKVYYLAGGAVIRDNNNTVELEDVDEGRDARLVLGDDGRVTAIEIADLSTVEGTVTGIRTAGTRWIVVETDEGQEEIFYADSRAGVREGDRSRSFDSIEVGARVRLSLNDLGKVSSVEITGIQSITGSITDIQTTGVEKLSLRDRSGLVRTYYPAEGVVIREGNRALKFSELQQGTNVWINLDNNGRMISIEVLGLSVVEGEVADIRPTGVARIDIKKSDGTKAVYFLGNGVKVREGEIPRSLADIIKGMRVSLSVDGRGDVTAIDIAGITTVEGKVKLAPKRGETRIGIEDSAGQLSVYDIDDSVVVWEGDDRRQPDYIYEGMRARLMLDGESRVTRIDILGVYTVHGRIESISANTMVVKDLDGKEKTYAISAGLKINKGTYSLNLPDLRTGMSAELTLDRAFNITHIRVY